MNVVRTTQITQVDTLPVVESVEEALALKAHKENGGFGDDRAQDDSAVSLIEAFFVTDLRMVPATRGALAARIAAHKKTFGDDYNPLTRAIWRVKQFRGKNDAFARR